LRALTFPLLQAALPFKSKPKLEQKRKRKTLEQRRAVVLEPGEKRARTLLQQLNAIRNEKARKRVEAGERRRVAGAKKRAREEEVRAGNGMWLQLRSYFGDISFA
jgi:ribosome biogenesis protein BMS1